jgi:hypothetical protein
MSETLMRTIVLAAAAAFLLTPAAVPAQAHHGMAIEHQEFAMAQKNMAKKKAPKAKKGKVKKEEYMRAVPSR